MTEQTSSIPSDGFLRLNQIIRIPGSKVKGPPILPISKTVWLKGQKSGLFPKVVSLGGRSRGYRVQDIRDLLERLGAEQ